MALQSCITLSASNRRQLWRMIASHLLWSCAVFGLWMIGQPIEGAAPWWSVGFIALQLWAAAQLLLPALLLHPEQRHRGFYVFWGMTLALSIWLSNQLKPDAVWLPLLTAIKSGLLLLAATLVGAALARYVKRLWEIAPVCLVMSLADLISWRYGPTAGFSRQIQSYYLAPEGQAPLIDMFLVKLASPGSGGLTPVFGISDWIMVVFFAIVARRYQINDNLIGASGETLARQGRIGHYLPISMVALLAVILLAQTTGLFIPALPLMALMICLWYAVRYLLRKRTANTDGH